MASNINPNNIDGAYPVAGQDNNSQGFRDNFTNIKTNFQFAEDELNDLQNKAVLKSALVGQTLDNNMNDALIYAARIQDFSATSVPIATTTGTVTVNYASGHYQTVSTAGNISLAFQNFPAAGTYGYLKIQINITNVAHTVTLPAAVSVGITGIQGISPGTAGVSNTITFGTTGRYEFGFGTNDGGSTITIFDLNRALTNFSAADLSLDDLTASGFVSAAGNVTGGNLITGGFASVTGNVTGANILAGAAVIATGNVTGGNITTAGIVSTTGNVQAQNVNGFVRPTAGGTTTAAIPLLFTAGSLVNLPTQTLTGGAFEYDGAAVYGAFTANQRGVMGIEHFITLTSDATVTNGATAQDVFPAAGTITLPASTTYFLDALYIVGPGSGTNLNAVTMSTLFSVTSALTNARYTADTTVDLATAVATTKRRIVTVPTATVITDAAAGGNESYFTVVLRGIIRTNAATDLTPQMAFSGVPAATSLRVLTSSYFRLQPVGTSSVLNVGRWS
jgi:hypothetical protein